MADSKLYRDCCSRLQTGADARYEADHQLSTFVAASHTPNPTETIHPFPATSSQLLHPDLLRQILLHLPLTQLAQCMRVSKSFYSVTSPVLYRTISYFPDRKGPTPLDGMDAIVDRKLAVDVEYDPLAKLAVLRYTKYLHMGYHHHNAPSLVPSSTSSIASSRLTGAPLHLPTLEVLHVQGERYCTRRSCPHLVTAKPKSVVVVKIDLFSGSPRWANPFLLACAETADRAVYLVQSPFFFRRSKWQGLDTVSQGVKTSIFILALREYEVEWRDTARKMSDEDAHGALVWHLSSLCMMAQEGGEVVLVGLELVAAHLRPDIWLSSAHPEDVVASFEAVVSRRVRKRWGEEGRCGDVEEQLARCRFTSMGEYRRKEARRQEVKLELLDKWASCWEHAVAASGIERR